MDDWEHIFSMRGASNIILHITLIVTFISIFFFTYGAYIEKKVVDNQMNLLVQNFTKDMSVLPSNVNDAMRTSISNINLTDMSKIDARVKKSNEELKKKAFMFIGILFAIGMSIVVGISLAAGRKYSLVALIAENIGLLIIVALTEFLFATLVLKNYRSADLNIVKKQIVVELIKFGNSCKA